MIFVASILAGAGLVLGTAYALGRAIAPRRFLPAPLRFAVGAAVESLLVFLLLCLGLARIPAFLAAGAAAAAAATLRGRRQTAKPGEPADRITRALFAAVCAAYGLLYFVNALAPEISPDGVSYHLGLVAEYVRRGGFPRRAGFFEMLPQGLEMLFVPAFAVGGHSAARLVHLAFLAATVPLLLEVARRLGMSARAGYVAAVFYACTPVVGVSGTAAYNDAALVFFTLACFDALLLKQAALAGLAAGFCFAIKPTGGLVAAAALLALRRPRAMAAFLAGAVIMAGPWVARNAWLAGNPAAPMFNRWFSNPYFHESMDARLEAALRGVYATSSWGDAVHQLAVGGGLQGIFGPLLFLLPLGLPALRRRCGRACLGFGAAVALAWFVNAGARFLMPALPFFALALAMTLPRPAAWASMAAQAVLCWPAVIAAYEPGPVWRLDEIPWRAAFRLEAEEQYLTRKLPDYPLARALDHAAQPGERVFSLMPVAKAYTTREVLIHWHSAEGDVLADALAQAANPRLFYSHRASWPARTATGVRVSQPGLPGAAWSVSEVSVRPAAKWARYSARPRTWEAWLAFDGNAATRWSPWAPNLRDMRVEAGFAAPQTVEEVEVLSASASRVLLELQDQDGRWSALPPPQIRVVHPEGLPRAATRALRAAGYSYLLLPADSPPGRALPGHETEWGLEPAAVGNARLFRIR